MDNTELIELVKKNYDVGDVYNAIKIKNVYRLKGYKNDFSLKIVHYEYGHFIFILKAILHLIENGFVNVSSIIKTKSGEDYIKIGEDYAYLTLWIDARQCNYDNPMELSLAAKTLASLHIKSENYSLTSEMHPRDYWFKWPSTFQTRINEILDFKNKIGNKDQKTQFDCMYLEMMNSEIEKGKATIDNLKSAGYEPEMKLEKSKGGFCHHDYAHHNLLIDKEGKTHVIDFDYCILDTHLHDLSSLLIRKMKNGKWDLDSAIYILDSYSSIYQIYKKDIDIMAAFMEFPQEFWQIGIQYYWEQQPWKQQNFLERLSKIKADFKERHEFIEEFRSLNY
ncbi:MAG: CotS family spore coat protein [Clostridium sp.]|nr:CotS family spore coat protein [Clostridium sp.]